MDHQGALVHLQTPGLSCVGCRTGRRGDKSAPCLPPRPPPGDPPRLACGEVVTCRTLTSGGRVWPQPGRPRRRGDRAQGPLEAAPRCGRHFHLRWPHRRDELCCRRIAGCVYRGRDHRACQRGQAEGRLREEGGDVFREARAETDRRRGGSGVSRLGGIGGSARGVAGDAGHGWALSVQTMRFPYVILHTEEKHTCRETPSKGPGACAVAGGRGAACGVPRVCGGAGCGGWRGSTVVRGPRTEVFFDNFWLYLCM